MGLFAGAYYWWPKMFGKLLDEKLGKVHFWTFLIGFHLTFFPQHFLGLFGMPRRVFTYQADVGLETLNLISTIGVAGMTIGTIAFLWNVYKTFKSEAKAPADPWNGRTLEWAIPSPPPEYNFAQLPRVRGYDALWVEKEAGNKGMQPAEPLGDIHMPSPSYIPILMSLGFFIAGFGFIARDNYAMGILGLVVVIIAMFMRSFDYDHGYHIPVEKIEKTEATANKGVKA
jgi:cytochrome c oxidase subunit 1